MEEPSPFRVTLSVRKDQLDSSGLRSSSDMDPRRSEGRTCLPQSLFWVLVT